jgi:two-component system copper resistance phosphate regulon response regulator CusR
MNILIAEDEKQISESLKKQFLEEGNKALVAFNGEEALKLLSELQFDVALLDWRMPKVSGVEVCRIIRDSKIAVPVILLTALSSVANKVEALSLGADDYIIKPFSFEELMARINAVTRRYLNTTEVLMYDNLELNLITRKVNTTLNEKIKLTDKEFDLFKVLILSKGVILSKADLCQKVWELPFAPQTNICEATIKNLRKKLEEATGKKYIKTIYGEGYTLIAD